ncbi:FecR family protein [Pedobacter nyackensis]|uniref:FecR family protein n=1 Tax=Pedobacter nyackensis TaxID=475255 RepID=UPI0029305020|nr:FecR family protein [Pedobacter nyackensis]
MERERIITLLSKKLAAEISIEELAELDSLMQRYPDVMYYDEAIAQIVIKDDFANDDLEQIYAAHLSKYAEEFTCENENSVNHQRKYFSLIGAIAAVFALVFGGYFLFSPAQFDSEIIAGNGVRKNISLPDGTSVWLNSGSKLRYNEGMKNSTTREVYLVGEAFFDVVKDKNHPFIIHTEKIAIKVLGTAFNVKAYHEENTTETTLIRGSIELSINNTPQQRMILKPKEKFALTENNSEKEGYKRKLVIESIQPLAIGHKEYLEETSWVENTLVFQNTSFEKLVPILERWYNIKIAIRNEKLKSYAFTGVFENETLEQALSAMQLIRSFKFKAAEDGTIELN